MNLNKDYNIPEQDYNILEQDYNMPEKDCNLLEQELLNTRMNNLYVQGFDDYVITEMINILCNE